MMVTVKIPTQLRSFTGGKSEVTSEGATVAQVIESLAREHPGLGERVLDESGGLRRFLNVYVDDEDVRFLKGLDTQLEDGARLSIIPAVAGG
jgi:sulfur-carrier protein